MDDDLDNFNNLNNFNMEKVFEELLQSFRERPLSTICIVGPDLLVKIYFIII